MDELMANINPKTKRPNITEIITAVFKLELKYNKHDKISGIGTEYKPHLKAATLICSQFFLYFFKINGARAWKKP